MNWIYQIILASVGATISGIILLIIHHSRVRQEVELHQKIEVFNRKQNAYRKLLEIINKLVDSSHLVGTETNWKIVRYVYDEVLLVGSSDVVKASNDLLVHFNDLTPEQTNEAIKKLKNSIRKDLYGSGLSPADLHLISPSPDTINSLEIYHKNSEKLNEMGIYTLDDIFMMDIDDMSSKSGIKKDDLTKIKKMSITEKRYDKELKEFLKD